MEQKTWWYSLNNDQKGPVTEEELNLLVNQNFISQNTPVWKEGMENWISFSDRNAPPDNSPKRPPLPPGFSQANTNGSQPANGNATQSPGNSRPAQSFTQPNPQGGAGAQASNASPDALNFITDFYYRAEFERIRNSNESYKGKFNWWAFFFSWLWCFTKGLWQLGLLLLIVSTAANFYLPFSVSGVIGLGIAIATGIRGTYFYYNHKIKNKQLF